MYYLYIAKTFMLSCGVHLRAPLKKTLRVSCTLSRKLIVAPEYSLLQPFVLTLHTPWCWKYGRGLLSTLSCCLLPTKARYTYDFMLVNADLCTLQCRLVMVAGRSNGSKLRSLHCVYNANTELEATGEF